MFHEKKNCQSETNSRKSILRDTISITQYEKTNEDKTNTITAVSARARVYKYTMRRTRSQKKKGKHARETITAAREYVNNTEICYSRTKELRKIIETLIQASFQQQKTYSSID